MVEVFFHCIVIERIYSLMLITSGFLSIIVGFLLRNKANQFLPACFEDLLKYA